MKMKKGKEKQRMRRLSALLLSLMLICAMSMTAFATEGDSVISTEGNDGNGAESKTADLSGHSFTAYQIFTGVYSDALGKLSNIEWGADANEGVKSVIAETLKVDANADLAVILTALEGARTDVTKANELAAAIASKLDMNGGTPVDGSTENLAHGYYIVIDTGKIGEGESRNLALLQCTDGKIDIKVKTGTVSSDKKVKDVNDSNAGVNGQEGEWGTSADYDIDDYVDFELTGTVAENYDMYTTYMFAFHDTQSDGLTLDEGSFAVKVYDKKGDYSGDISEYKLNVAGNEFVVEFDDLKKFGDLVQAGSVIKVSYKSQLNKKAVIGSKGNENKMYLEYSNNPSGNGTGKTPETAVVVFTYKVDISKVDGNGDALAGAGFTLYKVDSTYGDTAGYVFNNKRYHKTVGSYAADVQNGLSFFSFEGIDDGEYLLVETETPAGYNSIDPVPFTVNANHVYADGEKKVEIEGIAENDEKDKPKLTFSFGKISGELDAPTDSGTLATSVINQSGSLLPSTGGIGTTMFYIIGGILMVGACMMLFVRKIMTNEKR